MVLRRFLFAASLVFVMAGAVAQEAKPLLAGGEVLEAVYPGGFGVSYTEARPLAKALGLSYWREGDRLIMGLGALRLRLPVSAIPKSHTALKKLIAANPPHALKQGEKILVPLKYVARSLGCTYGGGSGSLRVILPEAKLLGISSQTSGGRDVVGIRFDRDVNLIRQAPGHWLMLGVRAAEGLQMLTGLYVSNVRLVPGPLGAELFLDGVSDYPEELAYYPQEARIYIGEKASKPKPKPLVVIDPGHGGADRGASYGNLFEKDIVLKVAKEAANILRRQGYRVELTRDKDVQVSFSQRASLAAQADVFVSLHTAGSPLAPPGPAIYTFVGSGARVPVFTARSRTLLAGGGYRPVLRYFAQSPAGVNRFVGLLEAGLGRIGVSARKGQTPLFLLERAPGAALLLELGSLSDNTDRARLSNNAQQSAFAQVIAGAIAAFLRGGS